MNNNNLKYFFSMISGEIYSVEEDEVKNLGKDQIPLKEKPNGNCKKCYGRFYTGRHNSMSGGKWVPDYYIPCPKCAQKCIDWNNFKEEVQIETTRTTNEEANKNFVDAINIV